MRLQHRLKLANTYTGEDYDTHSDSEMHRPSWTREYSGPTPPRRLGNWFLLISCNHSVRANATTRSTPSSLQTLTANCANNTFKLTVNINNGCQTRH